MQKLKPGSNERKFIFLMHKPLSNNKKVKGGFIDSNRIDTVYLAKLCEQRTQNINNNNENISGNQLTKKLK